VIAKGGLEAPSEKPGFNFIRRAIAKGRLEALSEKPGFNVIRRAWEHGEGIERGLGWRGLGWRGRGWVVGSEGGARDDDRLLDQALDECSANSREVVKERDEVVNEWEESAWRGVIRHVEEDEILSVVGEGV
jgi:hypothetical protein